MSVYKVPQDVEADDKLIGPFSFRQFVYLMIVGGLIMLGYALFQIFPGLALIPVPFILFFGALALPLRKDQPMETYLAAIMSFYLKPRKRLWEADGQDRILEIVAPEVVQTALKGLPEDEVDKRLTYLSAVVDSGGKIIKTSQLAQADIQGSQGIQGSQTVVIPTSLDTGMAMDVSSAISTNFNPFAGESKEYALPPANIVEEVPEDSNVLDANTSEAQRIEQKLQAEAEEKREEVRGAMQQAAAEPQPTPVEQKSAENLSAAQPKPGIMEIASNDNISIATMAREADQLDRDSDGEIMVSLR